MSLKEERKDYVKGELNEQGIAVDPFSLMGAWLAEAKEKAYSDYNAMVLSTISASGFPASRVVLLREFSTEGLVFYTNYRSEKGLEIQSSGKVCVNFFWRETEKQIRVSGIASILNEEKSDAYFRSRPRKSQIGAWASNQSEQISGREALEEQVKFFEDKFEGAEVPRPKHWGGFFIKPVKFEFWQGRASRLHDRLVYSKEEKDWNLTRISP